MSDKLDRVKTHFKNNWKLYAGIGVGATLAGVTYLIVRGNSHPQLNYTPGINGSATPGINGSGLNSVLVFENSGQITDSTINLKPILKSHRQGAPSWVVRCIETGEAFMSQRSAAIANGIDEAVLSKHLNGIYDHANDLHFERICMAA